MELWDLCWSNILAPKEPPSSGYLFSSSSSCSASSCTVSSASALLLLPTVDSAHPKWKCQIERVNFKIKEFQSLWVLLCDCFLLIANRWLKHFHLLILVSCPPPLLSLNFAIWNWWLMRCMPTDCTRCNRVERDEVTPARATDKKKSILARGRKTERLENE